jgi:Ala-tRNA(Pro) deacylase
VRRHYSMHGFLLLLTRPFYFPPDDHQWGVSFIKASHPSAATRSYLLAHGQRIRTFLNMGVVYGSVAKAAVAIGAADDALVAAVKSIDAAVSTAGSGFLSAVGDASSGPGALDAFVFASLAEPLSLLFPPAALTEVYPGYAAWAAATISSASFTAAAAVTGFGLTGGVARIGGQVDLRADCVRVSKSADVSIARNVEYKKAASAAAHDAEVAAAPPAIAAKTAAPVASPPPAPAAAQEASAPGAASQPASNKVLPTLSHAERLEKGLAALASMGIPASAVHSHAPALTAADLTTALAGITGVRIKNLFLKAKKARAGVPNDSRLWLVVARADAPTDLNKIAAKLGYAKDGVRFADAETLVDNLGVAQGHVSPIALANDEMHAVNVLLDATLELATEPLLFHPFTNEASVELTYQSLLQLISKTGHASPTIMQFQ